MQLSTGAEGEGVLSEYLLSLWEMEREVICESKPGSGQVGDLNGRRVITDTWKDCHIQRHCSCLNPCCCEIFCSSSHSLDIQME